MSRHWTALPNFVDCAVFRPAESVVEKQALRQAMGIPADALVIGCVAAVKKDHKRIDYLIREFAQLMSQSEETSREGAKARSEEVYPAAGGGMPTLPFVASRLRVKYSLPYLLIAGGRTGDTAELIALAESLIPGRYMILTDCSRDRMPGLYRAMDVFVLASLFEMMPIAILEGLASGLPVITNNHPVMTWMTGAENTSPQRHGDTEKSNVAGISSAGVPATKIPATLSGGIQREGGGDSKAGTLLPLAVSPFKKPFCEFSGCGTPQAENSQNIGSSSLLCASVPLAQRVVNSSSSPCGGLAIDMSREGALSEALGGLTPEWIAEHGRQARERALAMFSKEAVIGEYVEYYRQVLADEGEEGKRLHHQPSLAAEAVPPEYRRRMQRGYGVPS